MVHRFKAAVLGFLLAVTPCCGLFDRPDVGKLVSSAELKHTIAKKLFVIVSEMSKAGRVAGASKEMIDMFMDPAIELLEQYEELYGADVEFLSRIAEKSDLETAYRALRDGYDQLQAARQREKKVN